jgi:hypothetical protein
MIIHQLMKSHVKPICNLNENNEDGNNMAWFFMFECDGYNV